MSLVLELLAHVEKDAPRNVSQLLDRFLGKCREMTGSDAGTAYIVRRRGRERVLAPVARQNAISTSRAAPDDAIPLNAATIAGYVAGSGEVVSLDDVKRVPHARPYRFNRALEAPGFAVGALVCFPIMTFQGRVVAIIELMMQRDNEKGNPFADDTINGLMEVAAVISGYVERTDNLEQIEKKNVKLRQRNKALARQRERIGQLQEETEEAFKLSISLLARAAAIHDEGTGNHIVRVNEYAFFLAQRLGMPKEFCEEIRYSAQLHDVGKLSVDQGILNKGGELTAAERQQMDQHPVFGFQILSHSHRLKLAAEIALFHHEKWDGSGYPHGVRGEEIPISARIVALADTYDALRAERSYKPAYTHDQTVDVIINGDERLDPRGHFDPGLIEIFSRNHQGFDKIWQEFADT
ncbi:MAG: HD domain-containing phosphohydrolase [Alphaproteobacteria bacterium]